MGPNLCFFSRGWKIHFYPGTTGLNLGFFFELFILMALQMVIALLIAKCQIITNGLFWQIFPIVPSWPQSESSVWKCAPFFMGRSQSNEGQFWGKKKSPAQTHISKRRSGSFSMWNNRNEFKPNEVFPVAFAISINLLHLIIREKH